MTTETFFERVKTAVADRYELQHELGRGGMAVVYQALDIRHDRLVAIKVMRPEIASTVEGHRFHREIQIASRCQHPHILSLHDSGEADGLLYYVMPNVDGETLADRLAREGQLPIDETLKIAKEVGEALGYAHSRGVIHRDIKPGNIMLSGGHAIVMDFGVALALTGGSDVQVTLEGVALGTPVYMSPEQTAANGTVDARTDQYALACVIYETLAGEPPFSGPTPQAVMAKHSAGRVQSLRIIRDTVPEHVDLAIEKALAKHPADRFSTVERFVEALENADALWLSGGRRISPLGQRFPWGTVAAIAATLTLALVSYSVLTPKPTAEVVADAVNPARVAIRYFDDRSLDGSLSYLADSFTEDLIDALSVVGALEIIPRSGVEPFRDQPATPDAVREILGAGTIVDGSLELAGNELRITIRLIDAVRGTQLETRTLRAEMGEVFALREEVTDSVSRFLRRRLGRAIDASARSAGTDVVAAWRLVQQAEEQHRIVEQLWSSGEADAAAIAAVRSEALLQQASALDENWPEPVVLHGHLAMNRGKMAPIETDSPSEMSRADWLERAIALADEALTLKEGDPGALELRGLARYSMWQLPLGNMEESLESLLAGADADLLGAVESHPRPARALATLSDLSRRRGDFTLARQYAERAFRADAFLTEAATVTIVLGQTLLDLGRGSQALEICSEGFERFPDDATFPMCIMTGMAASRLVSPDIEAAWNLRQHVLDRGAGPSQVMYDISSHMLTAAVIARVGRLDSAIAVLERAIADLPQAGYLAPYLRYYEAVAWLNIGSQEMTLAALAEYLGVVPQRAAYIATDCWFNEFSANREFQELLDGVGATPAYGQCAPQTGRD